MIDEEYDDGLEPCDNCAGSGVEPFPLRIEERCHVCGGMGLQFKPTEES